MKNANTLLKHEGGAYIIYIATVIKHLPYFFVFGILQIAAS